MVAVPRISNRFVLAEVTFLDMGNIQHSEAWTSRMTVDGKDFFVRASRSVALACGDPALFRYCYDRLIFSREADINLDDFCEFNELRRRKPRGDVMHQ